MRRNKPTKKWKNDKEEKDEFFGKNKEDSVLTSREERQQIETNSSSGQVDSVRDLTAHVHDVIKRDQKNGRHYIQHRMSPDVRKKAFAELIRGDNILTTCIAANALILLKHLIQEYGADIEQDWECSLMQDGEKVSMNCGPLMKAVCCKNVKAAKILLSHGADVNRQTSEGFTAIHGACSLGDLNMVKCLVDFGADINQKTSLGTTALMNSKRNPNIREYLLEKGADVHVLNVYGRTALHQAVLEGCVQSVGIFVRCKVDIGVQDVTGNTALLLAVYNGCYDITHYLLDHNADPYTRNVKNADCFLTAAEMENRDILKLLVEKHNSQKGNGK